MTANMQEKFLELASALSPENLFMDGEATKAQAMRRQSEIMKQWRALEKQLGRKVSQDEVWNTHVDAIRSRWSNA